MNNVFLSTYRGSCGAFQSIRTAPKPNISNLQYHLIQRLRVTTPTKCRSFSYISCSRARIRYGTSFNPQAEPTPVSNAESSEQKQPKARIRHKFSAYVIDTVFSGALNWTTGNVILTELHKRRVNGSLVDHGIAFKDIKIEPELASKALEWLRANYPADEVTAGEFYAERELDAYKARISEGFIEKAQKWKILRDPSKKGKKNEVVDDSILVEKAMKWQAQRDERAKARKEKEAVALMEFDQKVHQRALDFQRRREELHEQREITLRNWEETREAAMLDTEAILDQTRSTFSRLFPSMVFGLSVMTVAAFFLDPSTVAGPAHINATMDIFKSPAFITCASITAVHVVLLLAWRFPRTMWYMNRYFLLSAGATVPISIFGATLSHQFFYWHLIRNTAALFALGLPAEQELGLSNFLSIYLISGIFGNLSSLTVNVLRRNFIHASIGASGATFGLIGALTTIQPVRDMVIPFTDIKLEVANWISFCVMGTIILLEHRFRKVDHTVHRAGFLVGAALGWLLQSSKPKNTVLADQIDKEDPQDL